MEIGNHEQVRQYHLHSAKLESNRQLFHIFFGIAIVALLVYDSIGRKIILAAIIVSLILSYFSKKIRIPVIYSLLEMFERKKDISKFPGKGMIFYLIGTYISLVLFPKDVAMASVMVLALGDSISHLYGLHFGRIKNPLSSAKFIEGTIAGAVFGFIGALVFLPWWESALASLAAMAVEAIEINIGMQQIDDNLTIPFVAGAVVWAARLF